MARIDHRVRFTKYVIRKCFLELLREKAIKRITVKELCERAGINRATFYAHYTDVFQLLESIEEELAMQIKATLERELASDTSSEEYITKLLEVIKENGDICEVMLADASGGFVHTIVNMCKELCIAEWRKAFPSITHAELERVYDFFASGSVGVIRTWFRENMRDDPSEIAAFLARISREGISSYA